MPNNNIRQQIFQLNNLSTDELKLKWMELFKTEAPNYRKVFLVKEIAYKIQILQGQTKISQDELKLTFNVIKKNLNASEKERQKTKRKSVVILPPAGSVITKIYKGTEHRVKVIEEDKFEYNGMIFKSLSSLAMAITGTKWNGYTFFGLKKRVN